MQRSEEENNNRGGFLIRFIDIGLIILFGFLIITDIEVLAQINMPGDDESADTETLDEMAYLSVFISAEGIYDVEDIEAERMRCSNLADHIELEACLIELRDEYRAAGQQPVVLVEPEATSLVQFTVDVLDICDRNGIPKNINVEALKL
jgi:biopolymer transport protein ExbD